MTGTIPAAVVTTTKAMFNDPFHFSATGFGPNMDVPGLSPESFLGLLHEGFPYSKTIHAAFHFPATCGPKSTTMGGYYHQVSWFRTPYVPKPFVRTTEIWGDLQWKQNRSLITQPNGGWRVTRFAVQFNVVSELNTDMYTKEKNMLEI